jgi:hypothetical protein
MAEGESLTICNEVSQLSNYLPCERKQAAFLHGKKGQFQSETHTMNGYTFRIIPQTGSSSLKEVATAANASFLDKLVMLRGTPSS